jgi:hypothetical protein
LNPSLSALPSPREEEEEDAEGGDGIFSQI